MFSLASRRGVTMRELESVRHSEISLGEIIDNFLAEQEIEHVDEGPGGAADVDDSVRANHPSATTNSIPLKLRKFYSHTSFRQIILSTLSILSIVFAFIGLWAKLIDSCSTLGFVTSVLLLFAPSPLACR